MIKQYTFYGRFEGFPMNNRALFGLQIEFDCYVLLAFQPYLTLVWMSRD